MASAFCPLQRLLCYNEDFEELLVLTGAVAISAHVCFLGWNVPLFCLNCMCGPFVQVSKVCIVNWR